MQRFLLCLGPCSDIEAVLAEMQHRLCRISEFQGALSGGGGN